MAITETIQTDENGRPAKVEYALAGGMKFVIDHRPTNVGDEAGIYFKAALQTLDITATKVLEVRGDAALSDLGKQQKLKPLHMDAVQSVAGAHANARSFERHIDTIEADLIEVPALHPTHSAVAVEDAEIRGWFRSQEPGERLSIVAGLEGNSQNQRIAIALLRSPIALVEQEAKIARKSWAQMKRLERPDIADEIDGGRNAIAWLDRGLGHIAGLTKLFTGIDDATTLDYIMSSPLEARRGGYPVFGFSDSQAKQAARRLDQQKPAA